MAKCASCVLLLAIFIRLVFYNTTLFLVTTDIIWSVLNYLDDSQFEYDGNIYLQSKPFRAVYDEGIDYNLKVVGNIPLECDGVIFKIGPNPIHKNVAIKYHWFDGDGMVHSIRQKCYKLEIGFNKTFSI